MNAKEKITKARAGLVLDQPFFGALALRQALQEDPTCETAWTDGQTIGYNPDWIENLSLENVKGVLAHEVMHIAASHHTRRQERDHAKWNIAGDYAINDILIEAGFSLPAGNLSGMGTDKSSEEIYNKLPDPQNNQDQNSDSKDPGNCGEIRDAKGQDGQKASQAELAAAESETKVSIAQASAIAKACGKMPGALERLVEKILEPIIDWKKELRRFLAQAAKNDYTWKKPNSRYVSQGLYLPALYSEEIGKLAIAIDTSGSINNQVLDQFISEIQEVRKESNSQVTIIYCDNKIQAAQTFEPEEDIELNLKGGGGTSFRPPFDHIEKNNIEPAAMIYLTDGRCSDFSDAPAYPVLWTVYNNNNFLPPFGEVIKIESFQ